MPNFSAETYQARQLEKLLHDYGAPHLWVCKRGAPLTIYSGVEDDPWPHVRLWRDTGHLGVLEMAVQGDRWERTPFRALIEELVRVLVEQFPWVIAPVVLSR